ncbi:hypothetical protein U1Q18_032831 [Sarracenia purpurea var. burkii]
MLDAQKRKDVDGCFGEDDKVITFESGKESNQSTVVDVFQRRFTSPSQMNTLNTVWKAKERDEFHYTSSQSDDDYEIKMRLYDTIQRMCPTPALRAKVDRQLEAFHNAKKMFGIEMAIQM